MTDTAAASRAPKTAPKTAPKSAQHGVHPSAIAELAGPIADEVGCALYDVQWRGGTLVVLASAAAGGAVGVEELGRLSRRLSAELDAADMIEGRYVLEVSSPGLERKLLRLKTSLAAVAPSDPALQRELAGIMTEMESRYGRGEYCPADGEECLDLPTMERLFASVRDTDELLELWAGWREVAPPMRALYERFVELSNAGARELGFADLGDLWRSGYDMTPDDFRADLERLWAQVRPLYEALHCHVRARLGDEFGTAIVPQDAPIRAHLLGNMWSQNWQNVYESVGPARSGPGYDLTRLLERARVDERDMVRYG